MLQMTHLINKLYNTAGQNGFTQYVQVDALKKQESQGNSQEMVQDIRYLF